MRLLFSKKDLAQTVNKGWIFEGTRGLEESLVSLYLNVYNEQQIHVYLFLEYTEIITNHTVPSLRY